MVDKDNKSFFIHQVQIKFNYTDVSDCLTKRLNAEEWYRKACQECTNHIRDNTIIESNGLTEAETKLWQAYLPNRWWKNRGSMHGPILEEPIREAIKKHEKGGAFERIEVWSNGMNRAECFMVVGLRQENYYHIAIQNNKSEPIKTICQVRKELISNFSGFKYHKPLKTIIVLSITPIIITFVFGSYFTYEIAGNHSDNLIEPFFMVFIIIATLILVIIITTVEINYVQEQKNEISKFLNDQNESLVDS